MFSKIWLINFALAVCVAFLGFKAFGVWSEEHESGPEMPRTKLEKQVVKSFERTRLPPEKTFEAVVAKNLFAPDRTVARAEETNGTGTEPTLEKDVEKALKGTTLYGVIIMDDYHKALVRERPPPPKVPFRGKRARPVPVQSASRWISIGDVLGGFKVAGISADRVSLEAGSGTYDLFLHDKKKPKNRPGFKTGSGPAVVVQTGARLPSAKPVSVPKVLPRAVPKPAAGRPGSSRKAIKQAAALKALKKAVTAPKPAGLAPAAKTENAAPKAMNPFEKILRMKGALPRK